MTKTILITGATDGIGLETARLLAPAGHTLLLHGRSQAKLDAARQAVESLDGSGRVATFCADLSTLAAAAQLADQILADEPTLDVLINNAGVFKTPETRTGDGLDTRFAVNTIAPYILARKLAPLLGADGRIVNLSSAGQAPVEEAALEGDLSLEDFDAYRQSKLAITMWTRQLADEWGASGPMVVAVNPGSLLATKMVKDAFGTDGKNIMIGADILSRAALSDEFADASGRYFDNDHGQFADPHADALDRAKTAAVVRRIDQVIASHTA